jgi:NAD-dependent dihydropyrimidine dehydrogenase PreA subunit
MALRDIISIDEELCDGCGECVPSCVEGALRIVNGKARVVADVLCDGMGACVGECPTGALKVIKRDAPEFDEAAVAATTGPRPALGGGMPGAAVLSALPGPAAKGGHHVTSGCPGSRVQVFEEHAGLPPVAPQPRVISLQDRTPLASGPEPAPSASGSRLRQWPVQLHLVPPTAPFFQGRHVLLAADCVPVAVPDFQAAFLDGRGLAIACPKLDQHLESYVEKLTAMVDHADIQSLTVAIMEVPCCSGLVRLAQQALAAANRTIPLRLVKIGIRGDLLTDAIV